MIIYFCHAVFNGNYFYKCSRGKWIILSTLLIVTKSVKTAYSSCFPPVLEKKKELLIYICLSIIFIINIPSLFLMDSYYVFWIMNEFCQRYASARTIFVELFVGREKKTCMWMWFYPFLPVWGKEISLLINHSKKMHELQRLCSGRNARGSSKMQRSVLSLLFRMEWDRNRSEQTELCVLSSVR